MLRKVVRFLTTEQFECEGRNKGPIYEAEKEYDFEASFADRWIQREVAVLVREYSDDPIIDAADPAQVEALQKAIDERDARQHNDMAQSLAGAREALNSAVAGG